MAYSLLHAAAERHRWVATALTKSDDQEAINRFADEVDGLSRYEIAASDLAAHGRSVELQRVVGAMLTKAFPPELSPRFECQLRALGGS